MRWLIAMALLIAACEGKVQPGPPTADPSPTPTAGPLTSTAPSPVASESGYLAGVNVDALTAESVARGLSCSTSSGGFSGDEPTKQVWNCDGTAADGSDLMMGAQGPDPDHIEIATAEVLTYGSAKDETIADYLGAMSGLFGGADPADAQSWLRQALIDARRDGSSEADVGANHYRLQFDDTGTSSATYIVVVPLAGAPSPTPGPLPSGAAYFGELEGVPGGWLTFVDPGGKFSIAFPGRPTVEGPETSTGSDGSIASTAYQWASSDLDTQFAVLATDYTQGTLSGKDPGVTLAAAADEYMGRLHADPAGRSATEVGDHAALDVITTNANGYVCLRLVIVGETLYVLVGTETHQCPAGMAGFVGSFKAIDP